MQESEDEEDSLFAKAFETDLVREGIFKYLSTSDLLSTCSLVSKNWNNKARSFIHIQRKCTPISSSKVSVCEFLENLNQLCSEMVAQGRVIPFNRLSLFSHQKCPQYSNVKTSEENLESVNTVQCQFVVKHLRAFIIDFNQSECSFHQPLSKLLSPNRRSELRTLTVRDIRLLCEILSEVGWESSFTKLQEFSIVGDPDIPEEDLPAVKDTVASLLKLAPNLVGIVALNPLALKLIPEEKYGLLKALEFKLNETEIMDMFRKIAKQSCQVEKFLVHEPPALTEYEDEESDEEFDVSDPHEFENAVQELVQNCHNSLRSISIKGSYSLAQFSHFPLTKLTKFKTQKLYDGTVWEFWDAIASVDYARVAPQLREMKIFMHTWKWSWDGIYKPGYEAERVWPENSDNTVIYGCRSVTKLTLEAIVAKLNLPLLKSFLPNIVELELWVRHTARIEGEAEVPDISEIFQLWPGLKELIIRGEDNCLKRSYDADFCGIHAEEVELLMEKDDNYLKAVHIVPIRPCLYTMTGKKLNSSLYKFL